MANLFSRIFGGAKPPAAAGPLAAPEDVARLRAWTEANALPAVYLDIAAGAPEPGGCRLGGPAFLADGEAWPSDRNGDPMVFLAQIDFSAIPAIADFPRSGLLQVFIATNDIFGCNFDDPLAGDIRIIWREQQGAGGLHYGEAVPDRLKRLGQPYDVVPFLNKAFPDGVRLVGRAADMTPTGADWRFIAQSDALVGNAKSDALDAFCRERDKEGGEGVHHIGGYPIFTQTDPRRRGRFEDYDRVLLRLSSDDYIQWGDVGEACFLIRREDLLARDFSRVLYNWDCF